ncbi:glycosyltransferase family 39 protein [Hymenobacter algoricola]|uniref:Glycosyltransferase RgtA/B/C/D-like domain-containing protein n=1 Tax=Hymenobacter algoricola TaxID=486267 RepID=A0ABP7N5M4_9BACT
MALPTTSVPLLLRLAAGCTRQRVVPAFFGLLTLLGLLLHRDFGVSWDEPTDHLNGIVNAKYIGQQLAPELARRQATYATIPELANYHDNDHGVAFEIPVTLLSFVFTPGDSRPYYLMRHLLIFFTFLGGTWALYNIGRIWLRDWRFGLAAAALLVLSPRFFVEAFTNGKDIVFMAFFTLAMYTLVRLLRRPTPGRAVGHGIATALAIDVRILALMLLAFTLVMVMLELLPRPAAAADPAEPAARVSPARWLLLLLLYIGVTVVGVIIGWPHLWEAPLTNFLHAFASLSHYDWPFSNLYFGRLIPGATPVWHYLPVWIIITTPVAYTLASLIGLGAWVTRAFRLGLAGLHTLAGRLDWLIAGWLLGPLLVIIVLHSVVYDSWRHVYFVYPALLLLAARGLQVLTTALARRSVGRTVALTFLVLAALELGRTVTHMVRTHPHEHVYFSFLPAATVERLFDRDYWCLSFRKGAEWILAHDADPQISINVERHYPLYANLQILPAADRARLHFVPRNRARYFMTTYRWHPQSFRDSLGPEVHAIYAGDIKILSVFRMR